MCAIAVSVPAHGDESVDQPPGVSRYTVCEVTAHIASIPLLVREVGDPASGGC